MQESKQLNVENRVPRNNKVLDFYNHLYLYPLIQRSVLLILFLFCATISVIVVYRLYNTFPLRKEIKYAVFAKKNYKKITKIIKADGYNNDAESSIAKILAENYVRKREEYDYEKISNRLKYVQTNSSNLIFRRYYNYINTDNIQSPILLYRTDTKKFIDIKKVSLNKSNKEFVVVFESRVINKDGVLLENDTYETTLNYSMKNINSTEYKKKIEEQTKENVLGFTVIEYKTNLIRKRQNA